MKEGTLYAKRVKKSYAQLRAAQGKPEIPEPSDPIEQLVLGLLSFETSPPDGIRALRAIREVMVDWNEVRVSTDAELARVIAAIVPQSIVVASCVRRALNAVYRKQHSVSLNSLHKLGRREARHYLEQLDGVNHYAAASVVLWSLGGHAIPVDHRLFEALRQSELVEPHADIHEVQAFLERNIAADEAKAFCLLMRHLPARPAGKPRGAAADERPATVKRPTLARAKAENKK